VTQIERAKLVATVAHGAVGQTRKWSGEPYIVHPAAVVDILLTKTSQPVYEDMLCAAWLHDVVEDTKLTLAFIQEMFGDSVARLVEQLTDISKPTDGNRQIRKRIDLMHTANASPEGKTIKLADLIDNTKSIVELSPGFAVVYMQEKEELLEVLKEGDQALWALAHAQVVAYRRDHQAAQAIA